MKLTYVIEQLSFVLLMTFAQAHASVRLPNLIADHMVVQRNAPVSIWGWADAREQVTVSFRGQAKSVTAGPDGHWQVLLDPMQSGGAFEMSILGTNSNQIVLRDVLVGEVWVASGQSNMWWPVRLSANSKNEIAKASYPNIRLFTVKQVVVRAPMPDTDGNWTAVSPETVADFSAVAYFFGREINERARVPVGLIDASWGATPVEGWISRPSLDGDLAFQPLLWRWKKALDEYPWAMERYRKQASEWEKEAAAAKEHGKALPKKPFPPLGSGYFETYRYDPQCAEPVDSRRVIQCDDCALDIIFDSRCHLVPG